jgi:hypothetical protein
MFRGLLKCSTVKEKKRRKKEGYACCLPKPMTTARMTPATTTIATIGKSVQIVLAVVFTVSYVVFAAAYAPLPVPNLNPA